MVSLCFGTFQSRSPFASRAHREMLSTAEGFFFWWGGSLDLSTFSFSPSSHPRECTGQRKWEGEKHQEGLRAQPRTPWLHSESILGWPHRLATLGTTMRPQRGMCVLWLRCSWPYPKIPAFLWQSFSEWEGSLVIGVFCFCSVGATQGTCGGVGGSGQGCNSGLYSCSLTWVLSPAWEF